MQAKVLVHREKMKGSLFYSSTEKIFFNFTLIIGLQNAKNNASVQLLDYLLAYIRFIRTSERNSVIPIKDQKQFLMQKIKHKW